MRELVRYLRDMPNLCGGGPLAAIVYCCAHGWCRLRDAALSKLGLSKTQYFEIKNRLGIKADEVCFRNLAYCCSLLKSCSRRDEAMRRLGISEDEYLQMKARILLEILRITRKPLEYVLTEKVAVPFTGHVIDEKGRVYGIAGYLYPDLGYGEIFAVHKLDGESELILSSEIVPLVIPRDLMSRVRELSRRLPNFKLSIVVAEALREKLEQLEQHAAVGKS